LLVAQGRYPALPSTNCRLVYWFPRCKEQGGGAASWPLEHAKDYCPSRIKEFQQYIIKNNYN
jgi:hypothetical protein